MGEEILRVNVAVRLARAHWLKGDIILVILADWTIKDKDFDTP
jgi:hypothetical protein